MVSAGDVPRLDWQGMLGVGSNVDQSGRDYLPAARLPYAAHRPIAARWSTHDTASDTTRLAAAAANTDPVRGYTQAVTANMIGQ